MAMMTVPNGVSDNKSALDQVMAYHQTGKKLLSQPMTINFGWNYQWWFKQLPKAINPSIYLFIIHLFIIDLSIYLL